MEKKQGLSCMLYPPLEHRQVYIYIYLYMQKSGRMDRNTTHSLTLSFRTTYPARSCTPRHAAVLLSKRSMHSLPSHPRNPPHPLSLLSSHYPILSSFFNYIIASHRTSRPRVTILPSWDSVPKPPGRVGSWGCDIYIIGSGGGSGCL